MLTLGIDTSNYTTSCAVFNSETGKVIQRKKLLPVKEGERGLRQSDAVFHHTAQLAPLLEELVKECGGGFSAIGVSARPRNVERSYMPCFTVGLNTARALACVCGAPLYEFSHQCGHITAALYSAGKLEELKNERFIAFHVSGGTTEMLLVSPSRENYFNAEIIGGTSDLNAGQAVDRVGVALGLGFPCGGELTKLALQSRKTYSPKMPVKGGFCSLSGVENKCLKMLESGEERCDIARFCIDCVSASLDKMTEFALEENGALPLVYAGGVMSNSIIREKFSKKYGGFFAAPEFSCDNAAGAALMAYGRKTENG